MRRCLLIALAACSSSAPPANEPAEPIALQSPPPAPAPTATPPDASVSSVTPDAAPAPTPTPTPTPTTGTPVARPCPRQTPVLFTVASDTQTHDQVCAIVDDYITFLGSPSLRAPDLALQFTVTLTDSACKVSIDVHLRTKLVMTVDGGGSFAPDKASAGARGECMRAVVNDQLGRQIVPALVRAGVTGPAPSAGTSAGSAS